MTWNLSRGATGCVAAICLAGLCGCQQRHMTAYQNGIKLGEWDLHQDGPGSFVTDSGQHVQIVPAAGIPLDTVTVGGGAVIFTLAAETR